MGAAKVLRSFFVTRKEGPRRRLTHSPPCVRKSFFFCLNVLLLTGNISHLSMGRIMKILVIEDEKKIAKTISDWFESADDEVTYCLNGNDGLKEAMSDVYDCVILDVMIQDLDGFSILKLLRKNGNNTPVIMLTARSDVNDKVLALTSGAEDYLTKPFDFKELEARVRIIGKKQGRVTGTGNEIAFNDLVLDLNLARVKNRNNGRSVRLPSKEFHLLEYFIKNAGQTLSKEQIYDRIWGYDADITYNNTEVYISFVRKKLKFIESDTTIETLRGIGYRLAGI